jgi:hypothetical protein
MASVGYMLGALVRVHCNHYLDGNSGVGGLEITASFGDLDRGLSRGSNSNKPMFDHEVQYFI